MSDENVSLSRGDLIRCLEFLNSIVPSLDRIGSASAGMERDDYCRLLTEYVETWGVAPKLAYVRRVLSEPLSYDELESLFENVPVWSLNSRQPPSE
jgi:hypothetical protein